MTFTYNASNQLTSVTNGMGRTLTFTYNTAGQIATVGDGTRTVTYGYDTAKNLTSVTDPLSNKTTFAYGSAGRLTQMFYPSEPTVAFITNTYDSLGRVSSQKDANGNVTNVYFAGSRTEMDDALGNAHVYYLSPHGKVLIDIDALSHQTVNSYDGLDRLVSTTLPEGNSVAYTYDNSAVTHYQNVLSTTANPKPGSGLSAVVTSATYNATWNKPATVTDALGHVTTTTYNATTGTVTSVAQPAVGGSTPTTSFTYNSRGQVLTKTDPAGKVTAFAYSASNETLTSITDDNAGLKLAVSYGYDTVGNVTSVTDPLGNVTTTTYDVLRRPTQVTAPTATAAVTKTTYDADSNVLSVSQATGNTTTPWQTSSATYTPTFKVKTATDANGNVTTTTYDALDRVASVTDPVGRVTKTAYDALSRMLSVTNTAIQTAPLASYTYTTNGKQATLTDARGNVTTTAYDGFDRALTTTYPDASSESQTYDAGGNVLTHTLRDGSVIAYTYDALNRPVTKAPANQLTVTTAYDLTGRVTSVATTAGTFSYGYDTAGRLISATDAASRTISYTLDKDGNRTRVTWPDAYYVTYSYDALNRMTAVKENGTTALAAYTWNPLSRRTGITYGNGAAATLTYDTAFNDLTTLTHAFVGSSAGFTYSVNKDHQRTGTSLTDASFLAYPGPSGSTSYAAGAMNQYTSVGTAAPTYDARGNLTGDGTNTFTYDTENRMTGAVTPAHTASYAYDPLGRRLSKTVDGTTTSYLSDGAQEIAEYSGTTLTRRYIYGPGTDEAVVTVSISAGVSTKTWLHQDALGSVVATSTATGAVGDKYAYGPFGETAVLSGSAFRFTGRRLDAETGLYYYRARMYSPALGRFMQTDPIGYQGGINLYAYVTNDPLNQTDPSGHCSHSTACGNADSTSSLIGDGYVMGDCNAGGNCLNPTAVKDNPGIPQSQVWDTESKHYMYIPTSTVPDFVNSGGLLSQPGPLLPPSVLVNGGVSLAAGDGVGGVLSCSANGSCYIGGGLVGGYSVSANPTASLSVSKSMGNPYGWGIQLSGAVGADDIGLRGSLFVGGGGFSASGGIGPTNGFSLSLTGGYKTAAIWNK